MLDFFHLPSIVTTDKRSKELSSDRTSQWLSKINQENLTACHRKDLNKIFVGSILLKGKPSAFTNSIEQENAELKRINAKLAQEITELKSEIQKYKFNEEKFKNDDQRVRYYTSLWCLLTL